MKNVVDSGDFIVKTGNLPMVWVSTQTVMVRTLSTFWTSTRIYGIETGHIFECVVFLGGKWANPSFAMLGFFQVSFSPWDSRFMRYFIPLNSLEPCWLCGYHGQFVKVGPTHCDYSWLVVWLPFFIFPNIGNNHPNWLSYFSEGWPNHQPDRIYR